MRLIVLASGACGPKVSFTLDEDWNRTPDMLLTITGEGDMNTYNSSTDIPWAVGREIGRINECLIEDGVTSITGLS